MRVLQITTNYPTPSNPIFGIFMKEQVESLEPLGVENTIFFSNGSETNVGKHHGGMKVHVKSVFKLMGHLLTHHYDVIHCHGTISGLILLLSGGAFFNKCVISYQNDPEKFIDGRYFKKLYPFFNKIIVKKPNKYMSRKKVVYLPNGCNTTIFKPLDKLMCKQKLGLDLEKQYILFVDSNTGKKRDQKRKDRFDETVQLLREKYNHQNIEELVMIGVNREDVPTYMNACDIHLLTSDQEGSPNSVKECLACGIPVVSTNVGNVEDLLNGIDGCYVTDEKDAEELAQLTDRSLKGQPYSNIRCSFEEKGLDINSVAKKLFELYKEIA
jgi:glycosyltransferase involved in cell wall biosynthesis